MVSNDEEIKFLYLLSGSSEILPPSCFKLRSYLNIHLSNLADQQNLQLLKSFRNRNKTCPYCYTSRNGDTTSFTLVPAKKYKKNRSQNKNSEGENTEAPESRNTLVLTCKVCRKKSSFSLVKKKFVEEKVREDRIETVKKKKKKRDKSCGLVINLLENDCKSDGTVVLKKKKRMEDIEKVTPVSPAHLQGINSSSGSQSVMTQKMTQKHTPIPKNVGSSSSKNLLLNPYAAQNKQGKKKNKQLERLKHAVKEEKSLVKKTLKDFLTLV